MARFAILRTLLVALTLCLGVVSGSGMALAQAVATETGAPDYDAWERDAIRATDVLETNRASVDGLQVLRQQLVSWRDFFLRRQSTNSEQIATLKSQISALGPLPVDGENEAAEIVSRRAELNAELEQLTAPVRRAEEAYTRAEGLVSRLDGIVRDRQTNLILELNPTPVNPALWPEAAISLAEVWSEIVSEVKSNLASPLRSEALKGSLPILVVLLVVGLALVIRGGAWVERALAALRVSRHASRARVRVGVFLTSLVSLILPIIGLTLLLTAANQSQLSGVAGTAVLDALSAVVIIIYVARWLGRQVAPPAYPPHPLLILTDGQGLQMRVLINFAGLLIAANAAISGLQASDLLSESAASVLGLPVIVLAGLFLFRIAQLMVASAKAAQIRLAKTDDAGESGSAGADTSSSLVLRYLGHAARVVAVIGPLLAAIGYTFAGNALVYSSYLTLAVLAGVAILQRLVRDIYAMIRGEDAGSKGLVPVLIGFALTLLSLPLLALIWGARLTDLSEVWKMVSAGVQLGDSRISPADFVKFAVIFAAGYGLTRLMQGTLKTQILPRTKLDTGGRNAMVAGTGYIGIFLAAVIAITSAGIDLSSLAIVAGALSVGIGFGLQTIVSNFVSGIILLIERPISEGDWIEVGGTMGVVRDISVRATRVETFDRRDVIVPNADLISTSVTNWTKGNLTGRIILTVGVAYGTDTRRVEKILREIAEAEPLVILNPPPSVLFRGFGADSLDFEIRAIIRDVNYVTHVPSEMNHEIARRFAEEGIEIPFAQRDVWLRNPEALGPPAEKKSMPSKQGPSKQGPRKPAKKETGA
jgi:small-conductance mechanosensitive channel